MPLGQFKTSGFCNVIVDFTVMTVRQTEFNWAECGLRAVNVTRWVPAVRNAWRSFAHAGWAVTCLNLI